MRFVSCYIVGFGCFVNRQFDLSRNIVTMKEDNGWGKTTLSAFLESMLYGFEGRSKDVSSNERMKYAPWSGGEYGGALVFIYNGKTYRIERSFGRTPSADTVRIFDGNNMLVYDFGVKAERLGEILFGLERITLKIAQFVLAVKTDRINAFGDGIKPQNPLRFL